MLPVPKKRKNPLLDRLSIFGAGVSLSALLTLLSTLLLANYKFPERFLENEDTVYQTPSTQPIGRTSYLAKIFLDQENELKGEMRFLAKIIEGRLSSHPNPHKLALQIVTESFLANYDPVFVAAVINAESLFKNKAISGKGAQGLMQLMPDTAKYISKQQNVSWKGSMDLHEPTYNLKLGIAYLKYLEKKFRGNKEKVLIAYNWGPGNLILALKHGRSIPSSPVSYARGILSTHKKWKAALTVATAANTNSVKIG